MRFVVRLVAAGAAAVIEEQVEADSEQAARRHCLAQGKVIIAIRRARGEAPPRRTAFDVSWWCQELSTLLRSGMTVVEAIETLAMTRHDNESAPVHAALLKALHEGQALSRAMQGTTIFPNVLVASVMASERTSTLPEALDDYMRYDRMLDRLRRQAVSAAIYPSMVIALALAIIVFLLLFVIPRFSRMYVENQASLSSATQAVLWLSKNLQGNAVVIAMAITVVAGAAVAFAKSGSHQRLFSMLVAAIPPLGRQIVNFELAKLYQSLALMFRGGYTLDEALAVGETLGLSHKVSLALAKARSGIARGQPASAAFVEAGLTETVSQRLLAVGERSGGFDAVLQTIADRHAAAFGTFIERATRIVEPVLLLVVALVIGGIVTMMYMPIFDMAASIGGGP